jgi:hypothetical protein
LAFASLRPKEKVKVMGIQVKLACIRSGSRMSWGRLT